MVSAGWDGKRLSTCTRRRAAPPRCHAPRALREYAFGLGAYYAHATELARAIAHLISFKRLSRLQSMVAQGREDARRLQPGVRREDVRDASRPRLEPLATHRTLSDRREVSRILSVRGTLGFVRGTSQQHQITASSGIFFMFRRKNCARSAPARSAAGAAAQRREAPTGAAQRREAPPQAAEQRALCKVRFCAGNFRTVGFAG